MCCVHEQLFLHVQARLLLRLTAALVVTNVVHASSVITALRQVVDAANKLAQGAAVVVVIVGWTRQTN